LRQPPAVADGFALEPTQDLGIGQMPAVPRQHLIGATDRGEGQMCGVGARIRRQRARGQKSHNESFGFRCRLDERQLPDDFQPAARLLGVPTTGFALHLPGSDAEKLLAPQPPPVPGDLLIGRHD